MSKKQKIINAVLIFLIIAAISAAAFVFYATSHKKTDEDYPAEFQNTDDELADLLENARIQKSESENDTEDSVLDDEPDPGGDMQEEQETQEALKLTDIYAENGDTAVFKCYDSGAAAYEWEYYDMSSNKWNAAAEEEIQNCLDELGRNISGYKVKAEESMNGTMVRCTIHFQAPDRENEIQEASFFILPDKIKKISLEEFTADANVYLGTKELPVKVFYTDGTDETITGLNNLYFVIFEEKKDQSVSISGNRVETTTLTTTECDYLYTGMKEQEQLIRYHPDGSEGEIEALAVITGKDELAPVISEITVSPYEISSTDGPVTLSVNIKAEDNVTPYPNLEYAFLFSGQEPTDADWIKKASFDAEIERNGIYTVYVRDSSGNTAQMEKEIITVDMKAPVIKSVTLINETGWCKSNTIQVSAQDTSDMMYCYESRAGESSGWITYNEYTVDANGIWTIHVKDAAGNISDTEVEITNIDKEAPVIHNIRIK